MNFALLPGPFNGVSVFRADCQRFFHHHVDAAPGADLHHAAMIVSIGVRQHCLRMCLLQHVIQVGEEQFAIQPELSCILGRKLLIRLRDANNSDVQPMRRVLKKTFGMSMHQSRNRYAKWSFRCFRRRCLGKGVRDHSEKRNQHEEQGMTHFVPPPASRVERDLRLQMSSCQRPVHCQQFLQDRAQLG